jgi:hypothetical protein
MRSVFTDREPARVGYFQSVLENEGILTFIRNQLTNTTMSEMPSGLFFPVLCVVNDEDFDRAIALILEVRDGTPDNLPEWTCEKCHEAVPGGFDLCWNCGAERPTPSDG